MFSLSVSVLCLICLPLVAAEKRAPRSKSAEDGCANCGSSQAASAVQQVTKESATTSCICVFYKYAQYYDPNGNFIYCYFGAECDNGWTISYEDTVDRDLWNISYCSEVAGNCPAHDEGKNCFQPQLQVGPQAKRQAESRAKPPRRSHLMQGGLRQRRVRKVDAGEDLYLHTQHKVPGKVSLKARLIDLSPASDEEEARFVRFPVGQSKQVTAKLWLVRVTGRIRGKRQLANFGHGLECDGIPNNAAVYQVDEEQVDYAAGDGFATVYVDNLEYHVRLASQ
jgi:hypothetical protein